MSPKYIIEDYELRAILGKWKSLLEVDRYGAGICGREGVMSQKTWG
jgi:hypothetical protein